MSVQGGAKARHRASSSRVVPAIPLALESRSRRSTEQNKLPAKNQAPIVLDGASGPVNGLANTENIANGTDHSRNAPVSTKPTGLNDELKEEPVRAGSESSRTDAAPSSQTNGVNSATAASQPQSATSTSFPINENDRLPAPLNPAPRPDSGGGSEPPHPLFTLGQSGSTAAVAYATRPAAGPYPDAPTFVPHGHNYHFSEPYAGPVYPPPSVQSSMGSQYPQDLDTNALQASYGGPMHVQHSGIGTRRSTEYPTEAYPAQGVYSEPAPHLRPDSASVEAKDSFSATYPTLIPTSQETLADPSRTMVPKIQLHAHTTSSSFDATRVPPDPKMAFMAAAYLYEQFAVSEFADCMLIISHSESSFAPISLPAHAVVLARSPKLRSLLKQKTVIPNRRMSLKEMKMVIKDPFLVNSQALVKAVNRLYSGMLPDAQYLIEGFGLRTNKDCMKFALSFAAAGHFMEIDEIINCGTDLVNRFLDLETIELALAFGIDGGISPLWQPRDDDSSEESMSTSSSFDGTQHVRSTSVATYGIYSDKVLREVFQCLFAYTSPHFIFDDKATQLASCARLPVELERRHNRSNSRLSQIRFGDMTLEDESSVDIVRHTLSMVLLSFPYALLKHFLEHSALLSVLEPASLGDLMRAIVRERESRRKAACEASASNTPSSMTEERLWENLQWSESVEQSQHHPSGCRLSRRRVGSTASVSPQS